MHIVLKNWAEIGSTFILKIVACCVYFLLEFNFEENWVKNLWVKFQQGTKHKILKTLINAKKKKLKYFSLKRTVWVLVLFQQS